MNSTRAKGLAFAAIAFALLLGPSHGQVGTTRMEPAKLIPGLELTALPVGKTIGIPPQSAKVRELLEQKADFDYGPCCQLGDLVTDLRKRFKVPLELDVAALTADGKGTETIVNVHFKDVTLRSGLRRALEMYGLTYVIEDEFVGITTRTAAETKTTTRVYQVHDLVLRPNDPTARPDFISLIELITSTILVETWRDAGGMVGSIQGRDIPGAIVLVVTHNDDGHDQVENLLALLRAAKIPGLYELQYQRERTAPDAPRDHGIGLPPGYLGGAS